MESTNFLYFKPSKIVSNYNCHCKSFLVSFTTPVLLVDGSPNDQFLTTYQAMSLMYAPQARAYISIYSTRVLAVHPTHHDSMNSVFLLAW